MYYICQKDPSVIAASLRVCVDFPADLAVNHNFTDYISKLKYRLKQKLKATYQDAKKTAFNRETKKINFKMSNQEFSPETNRFLDSQDWIVEARRDFNNNHSTNMATHSKNANDGFKKD